MADKYLVISPSGGLRWEEFERDHWFPRMYEVIGCDCVEQVRTVIPGICIVIDESGKIKCPVQPHNELASRLYYGYHVGLDNIVGPAVVVALRPFGPYQELDWFPLDPAELARLSLHLGVAIPDQEVQHEG